MTGPNGSTASPLPELQPQLQARQFDNPVFALGLAVNYLMTKPAFARLSFGHWSRVLVGQINRRHYFFAFRGQTVVGFAGWALASRDDAEIWLTGKSNPALEDGRTGNCIILNAWAATTTDVNKFLLDEIRRMGKDKEMVYAKREYPDGRSRPLRLSVNDFVESHLAETGQQSSAAAKSAG